MISENILRFTSKLVLNSNGSTVKPGAKFRLSFGYVQFMVQFQYTLSVFFFTINLFVTR